MNTVAFPKLGIGEITMNQFVNVFGFDIAWYGIIIALGFVLATVYVMKRIRQFGLDSEKVIDCILFGMIGGIIGGRLYYVIFDWNSFKDNLIDIFNTRAGGLAIYGGIIGALLVGLIVCKIRKIRILPLLDIICLGFLIGQGVGRWGNFVNVEAYGSHTESIFGMVGSSIVNGPVHPCFLYESVWCLLGFVLLHFYSKRRKFDGEVGLLYLIWYGFGRAIIEGLRTDSLYLGNLRVSQILSILIFIGALIVWLVVRSRIKRNNDPEYLKLYVNTEESKEELRLADEKSNHKKKKKDVKDVKIEQAPEDGVPQDYDPIEESVQKEEQDGDVEEMKGDK